MMLHELLGFDGQIHIADIGASLIAEQPPYKPLIDRNIARLSAFDGDERQIEAIMANYGPETRVYNDVIADGRPHRLHLATPASGMSSILEPSPEHLAFFNGFELFGAIEQSIDVDTRRLADVDGLDPVDYIKMDIQGAELIVLENAGAVLDQCVCIQLEASFVPLYKGQPSLGDIDRWMRANGYLPHCFTDVKKWSIKPTVQAGNFRIPFNQLLECDIVYMRDLVDLSALSIDQVMKIALIALYCYKSPDLCIHAVLELERRGAYPAGQLDRVMEAMRQP